MFIHWKINLKMMQLGTNAHFDEVLFLLNVRDFTWHLMRSSVTCRMTLALNTLRLSFTGVSSLHSFSINIESRSRHSERKTTSKSSLWSIGKSLTDAYMLTLRRWQGWWFYCILLTSWNNKQQAKKRARVVFFTQGVRWRERLFLPPQQLPSPFIIVCFVVL